MLYLHDDGGSRHVLFTVLYTIKFVYSPGINMKLIGNLTQM